MTASFIRPTAAASTLLLLRRLGRGPGSAWAGSRVAWLRAACVVLFSNSPAVARPRHCAYRPVLACSNTFRRAVTTSKRAPQPPGRTRSVAIALCSVCADWCLLLARLTSEASQFADLRDPSCRPAPVCPLLLPAARCRLLWRTPSPSTSCSRKGTWQPSRSLRKPWPRCESCAALPFVCRAPIRWCSGQAPAPPCRLLACLDAPLPAGYSLNARDAALAGFRTRPFRCTLRERTRSQRACGE